MSDNQLVMFTEYTTEELSSRVWYIYTCGKGHKWASSLRPPVECKKCGEKVLNTASWNAWWGK